jgi:hypothetical protein
MPGIGNENSAIAVSVCGHSLVFINTTLLISELQLLSCTCVHITRMFVYIFKGTLFVHYPIKQHIQMLAILVK